VILLFLHCNIHFTLPICKDIVNVFNVNKVKFQFPLITYSISIFQLNLLLSSTLLIIIYSSLIIFKNQNEIPKSLEQQYQEILTKPITF
jgi:hypothetical protein